MEAYVFARSMDGRQAYVEKVLAATDVDAAHVAIDASAALADAHQWTTATLTAGDGHVPWVTFFRVIEKRLMHHVIHVWLRASRTPA
jgi:hypothetical protein